MILGKKGIINYLGKSEDITADILSRELEKIIDKKDYLLLLQKRSLLLMENSNY